MLRISTLYLAVILFAVSCSQNKSPESEAQKARQVKLVTSFGDVVIQLSNKTPLHRDNFLKIVNEGRYDSLLFHRVIEGFVIQGGDPESINAQPLQRIGKGGLDYLVPAEFDSSLFHRTGAVGAARKNDPDRASNAMQFYMVQASIPLADTTIDKAEKRINGWLKEYYTINTPENKIWRDSLSAALANENWVAMNAVGDTISKLAVNFTDFTPYTIPEEHRSVYKSSGGIPHLDQNYTIFGQVVEGMNVVDSIAAVATDSLDRPFSDVRILSAEVLK